MNNRRTLGFSAALIIILLLPLIGPGGVVASIVLGSALLGAPLFVLLGTLALSAFYFLADGYDSIEAYQGIVTRFGDLGEKEPLLAIIFFMLSGTIMARGEISRRLVDFSRALIGWAPGGLAVSGVLACMLFASISGSSPATVVAIGGMLAPTLLKQGYSERFSHGLLMSAGSLGILIPPSIPMIIYPIVNQEEFIEVERLFAAGFGPGLLIGGIFAAMAVYRGIRDKTPVEPFELARLRAATVDGFWAILFPITILGGIYGGILTAVEASAFSVVYALLVEIFIHRALVWRDVPIIIKDTTVLLGSLLVIMVAAYAFTEYLSAEQIPAQLTAWIESFDFGPIGFLLIVNVLLILVGMAMDIMSAMFVFVPLLAPIAAAFGIDPVHFGIIFIVNLEIGYLTPPVGLNLFVGSNLFERSMGHVIRAVLPFVLAMLTGLMVVTYVPAISIGFADVILGAKSTATGDAPEVLDEPRGMTLEEMMREAEGGGAPSGRVQTLEEMMREAEAFELEDSEPDDAESDDSAPDETEIELGQDAELDGEGTD